MPTAIARYVGLLALSVTVGCPLFGGNHGTTHTGPGSMGGVHSYTDSDVIAGVAATSDALFVATGRGVLKYPLAGGAPTRLGTEQGLPDSRVFAISASGDGTLWAATPRGVARFGQDQFALVGETQPDVGRITAILALEGGSVLVGGSAGIAHFDGTQWAIVTNQYQVTSFALDQGRPLVATAQNGILALRGDYTSLDEYGQSSGIPEPLVRSFVPVGNGRFWALVQGVGGSKLGFFDGHRWFGYTSQQVRAPWLAVVPFQGGAALIVQGAFYQIVESRGEELIATEAGNPTTGQRVQLTPEVVAAPPPPPPPPGAHGHPRPAAPPPRRGAGRGQHAAPRVPDDGAMYAREFPLAGPDDERSAQARRGAAHAADAGASPAPTGASAAPNSDGGAAGDAAVVTHRPPPRPRNIPAYASPVDVPSGSHPEAPTFGLARPELLTLPDDLANAWGDRSGLYIWRIGLGVSRVAGGTAMDYRSHDLAMQTRPLSLATDVNDNVWFVTEDGGPARYDGVRFARVQIDSDGTAVPLMFWSRGTVVVAVARVGPNQVRTYRFTGNAWHMITERPIDTGGPGTIDVKFLAVDEHGRFWLGIRVHDNGHAREYGVAMIDEALPAATQFNSHTPPTGAVQGAAPAPDDLTAVEFDTHGTAWFAGLSGATSVTLGADGAPATVHTYNETNGLHGDSVNDVTRGPGDRVYFATPEGLGYWNGTAFGWDVEGSTAMPRAIAITVDGNGSLWGVGPRGAWTYDGHRFISVGQGDGLTTNAFNDVATDGQNRVWFVTSEGISILSQAHSASATPSTGETPASSEGDNSGTSSSP